MKRATASSVYEGRRGRKRCRTGEVENSRKARMAAKDPKYKCRGNFTLPSERTIVTRSMAMKTVMKEKKVEAKAEEEAVVGGVMGMKLEEGLEKSPATWTYEEEWRFGWHPYWEVMSGLDWVSRVDPYDLDGDFWEDDLWNLKNISEIPKP